MILKQLTVIFIILSTQRARTTQIVDTVSNDDGNGGTSEVRTMSIPLPSPDCVRVIHCCNEEEKAYWSQVTHHYCDVFTRNLLAPLPLDGELFVRLDDYYAEKISINRSVRIAITSADGELAQWRVSPTFSSRNLLAVGAPIVDGLGRLVTVVTARRGCDYALSTFDGVGGYFETTSPWQTKAAPKGRAIYGEHAFLSRDELREYISSLPPLSKEPCTPSRPVLWAVKDRGARVALVNHSGRQFAHIYLPDAAADEVEYL